MTVEFKKIERLWAAFYPIQSGELRMLPYTVRPYRRDVVKAISENGTSSWDRAKGRGIQIKRIVAYEE